MNRVLNEAERLHKLGFAILWLRPKSKAPVRAKWTTGPRESWDGLKASYKEGYNVGVRLGAASKIGDGYLGVIDIDIKSKDPKHRKEAETWLKHFFKEDLNSFPIVKSGRGNGSHHIYFLNKEVTRTQKMITSKEKVELFINGAMGMRSAWEISVMGEGSQVVLPPSIHPDSFKEYIWQSRIEMQDDLHFLGVSGKPKLPEKEVVEDFKPVAVDLSTLDEDALNLLINGGDDDQSVAVFKVCAAMAKIGWTDHQVMSALTDKQHALGEVAYRHAGNTLSRSRAAQWILNHNIKKARLHNDPKLQFDNEVETILLNEEESKKQQSEIIVRDWQDTLERMWKGNTGPPKPTVKNIRIILQNELGPFVFKHNSFSKRDIYGVKSLWNDREASHDVRDIDVVNMQSWLADKYRVEPSPDKIFTAIRQIASENAFHPVKDYLNNLEWDGVSRIDTWLKDYLGAEASEPYLSAVSRKVLCAMVARIFRPGVKFDHVLVLEGAQDAGKTTVVNILGGPEWTLDTVIDFRDKDSVMAMQGMWIVELGELASLNNADIETMKSFITRLKDRVRKSYGTLHEDYPRQCIFIGTTNSDEYLKDPTGNRRFWPVKTTLEFLDLAGLRKVRDQLFAEAVFTWRELDEPLWLADSEEKRAAKIEQEDRVEHDIWVDQIEDFFEREKATNPTRNWDSFTMSEMFSEQGPLAGYRWGKSEQRRAGDAFKKLGYKKDTARKNGKVAKVWFRVGTGIKK